MRPAAARRSSCSCWPRILTGRFQDTADDSQVAALFGTFSIGLWGYVAVIAQVVLIAVVTAATSRYTVNRTIESLGVTAFRRHRAAEICVMMPAVAEMSSDVDGRAPSQ